MDIFKKLNEIADQNEIKKLTLIVQKINDMESDIKLLSDEKLQHKTIEFKERLELGESLDELLIEAFAVVREASKRILGMRQYDVQLLGGIVLHQGKIAEMKTGEGKTLVAVAPVYLNALEGRGVHVVTVNDYLAKRDKEIMQPVYEFLGLSVGVVLHGQEAQERKEQYNCDITYGTNNEFGFDYLKDNMVSDVEELKQRELNFAIVDEIDSILVDEARTPLIISGQIGFDEKIFRLANVFIKMLLPTEYTYKEKEKAIFLNDKGIDKAERFFKIKNLMDVENIETYHYINQALKADVIMKRDIDYVVRNGCVEIVDEFTGRVMEGRRFSEGLHQAIEAAENLEIKHESKTLATITYQNLFRMYKKLSGMTGTAKTEENEFESTYKLNVIQIPTNKPVIREDMQTKIFKTKNEKYKQILKDIQEIHSKGQPILIGTSSIRESEIVSNILNQVDIKHTVLNAKNHEKEAKIIAMAGRKDAVTVSTNMAGRGTDISLGEGVANLGGLYVIGTEKNENRRIDNQLKGRSGRQGDPGASRFYVSLEDDMIKLHGASKIEKISQKLEDEGQLNHKTLEKLIENAQINLESKNFSIRKEVLKYDDVMNKQRQLLYTDRNKVLHEENLDEILHDMYLKINTEQNVEKDNRTEFTTTYKKRIILSLVDKYWVEHLDLAEQLKKAVPLQAVGQKDPVKEYTRELFDMFDEMNDKIAIDTVNHIYR